MSRKPDPIDVHVGQRVRARRQVLGLSQSQLGAELGVTFQQVQKYERGTNRIGSSRLFRISRVLDVPISYFFDEYSGEVGGRAMDAEDQAGGVPRRETDELVRAYYRIREPRLRKQLLGLARMIGVTEQRSP